MENEQPQDTSTPKTAPLGDLSFLATAAGGETTSAPAAAVGERTDPAAAAGESTRAPAAAEAAVTAPAAPAGESTGAPAAAEVETNAPAAPEGGSSSAPAAAVDETTEPVAASEQPAATERPHVVGSDTATPNLTAHSLLEQGAAATAGGAQEQPNAGGVGPLSSEALIAKYGLELVTDMEDARLLISYVSRNGLIEERKLDPGTLKELILARERLRFGLFDCVKEETDFRTRYGILAHAAAPVSVASLKDSLPSGQKPYWFIFKEGRPNSDAERASRNFRLGAMLVLTLLAVTQVYWTVCSSLLGAVGKIPSASRVVVATPTSAPTTPPLPTNPEDKKKADAFDLVSQSRVAMLAAWMRPFLNTETKTALDSRTLKKPVSLSVATTAVSTVGSALGKPGAAADGSPAPAAPEARADAKTIDPYTDVCVLAEQLVGIIQAWLLPLLYGALGAMVFIVRTLAMQARDRLFRNEAQVTYHMRTCLGVISGLAIGWFWKDPNPDPTSVTALSPFALAFVAGYGVEILFTLLDKIVTTFTNKPSA